MPAVLPIWLELASLRLKALGPGLGRTVLRLSGSRWYVPGRIARAGRVLHAAGGGRNPDPAGVALCHEAPRGG